MFVFTVVEHPGPAIRAKGLSAAKGSTTELKTITSDFHMTLGISTYMRNKQCGLPGLPAMSIIIILKHMKTAKTLLA